MNTLQEPLRRYAIVVPDDIADESLAFWDWCIPATSKVIFITKFGDWFLRTETDEVLFLDILEGRCHAIEATTSDVTSGDFAKKRPDLLSVDWIEVLTSKGYTLSQNECFGWKIHPMLGGSLDSTNIKIYTFRVYQSISSQLHRQFGGKEKSDNP